MRAAQSIISGSRSVLAMSCVSAPGREILPVCLGALGAVPFSQLKDYRDKCLWGPRASSTSPYLPIPYSPASCLVFLFYFLGVIRAGRNISQLFFTKCIIINSLCIFKQIHFPPLEW